MSLREIIMDSKEQEHLSNQNKKEKKKSKKTANASSTSAPETVPEGKEPVSEEVDRAGGHVAVIDEKDSNIPIATPSSGKNENDDDTAIPSATSTTDELGGSDWSNYEKQFDEDLKNKLLKATNKALAAKQEAFREYHEKEKLAHQKEMEALQEKERKTKLKFKKQMAEKWEQEVTALLHMKRQLQEQMDFIHFRLEELGYQDGMEMPSAQIESMSVDGSDRTNEKKKKKKHQQQPTLQDNKEALETIRVVAETVV